MTAALTLPLAGRTVVVTGVSRRRGIGYAIASRLAGMGANLFIHHYSPYDAGQPWGADSINDVVASLRAKLAGAARLEHGEIDLAEAAGGERVIEAAASAFGHLDALVCNHALSAGDGRLADMTAESLDSHWAVNTRATLLATRDFAAQHDGRAGGRVIWMTSGQNLGPMSTEIAYATSKAALAGMTPSVANDLISHGIVLNTVNPGPVNTAYLDHLVDDPSAESAAWVADHFPAKRIGEPDDPARLIAWLISDEGRWMVGQVLNTEGGFRR